MENKEEEKSLIEKTNEKVEKKIEELINSGIRHDNVDYLYKLVDIHKDLKNEEYWKLKGENMMYRDNGNYGNYGGYGREQYGTYGGGRRRDSRGRYMEDGRSSYGRRYRGEDMLDDMTENYGAYMGNHENGRYGSPETTEALEYMLQSAEDFFKHIQNEAKSPEEIELVKRTARRISEM